MNFWSRKVMALVIALVQLVVSSPWVISQAEMSTDSINDFFDRWAELSETYWTARHSGFPATSLLASFVWPMTPIGVDEIELKRQEANDTYASLTRSCIGDVDDLTISQINTAHDRCDAALVAFFTELGLERSGTAILAYQAREEDRQHDLETRAQSSLQMTVTSTPVPPSSPVPTPVSTSGTTDEVDYHTRLTYYPAEVTTRSPTPRATNAGTPSVSVSGGFYDVTDATPYALAIQFVKSRNIVGGFPDGTFKPQNTLTRAELLKMVLLAKYEENDTNGPASESTTDCFPDVDAVEWYAKFVCFAKEHAILNGYSDGTFRPNQTVSYIEALKIALNTLGYVPSLETNPWYDAFLSQADAIKSGISETKLNDPLTRAKMAELITRILKYKNDGESSAYLSGYQNLKFQASAQ